MLKDINLSEDLLEYIYKHSQPLHSIQKEILNYNRDLGDIQRLQISETQSLFLQLIIKINKVRKCLEIGTFTGFSTLSMALALPENGKITTLDNDKKIVAIASDFFKKADLSSKIETIVGSALDTLKNLLNEKKKFDLIFIDADKGNYKKYYDLSLNLISESGLIIIDNVLWKGEVIKNKYVSETPSKQLWSIIDFNKYVRDDNKVEKFILPIGDGLTICRKK